MGFLAPLDLWAVSRYAQARTVLSTPEAFSAALAFGKDAFVTDRRPGSGHRLNLRFAGDAGGVVSSTDGEAHAGLRRMVAKLLSKPRLNAADDAIRTHVHRLMAGLAARTSEFDVVDELAKPVATAAIGALMGLPDDLAATLASWADLTFRAMDPGDEYSLPAAEPEVMRANLASNRAVLRFLRSPAAGELSVWWQRENSARAHQEVLLSVLQLFQAGYETIVSAISHIVAEFLVDRADSPVYLDSAAARSAVIEEGIRLASPVRATFRVALRETVLDGIPIPAGASVMVLLGSANQDEEIFPALMRCGPIGPVRTSRSARARTAASAGFWPTPSSPTFSARSPP